MTLSTLSHSREHFTAMACALALHVGAVVFVMLSAEVPSVVKQQIIQIRMVAPSSLSKPKTEPLKKLETRAVAPPKPDSISLHKKQERQAEEQKTEQSVAAATPPTSGLQAPDATAKAAARTEPLFNADYLNNPPPVYPMAARRQNVEGRVLLKVTVTATGNAGEVEIARSSGSSILDHAARSAVSRWRFVPARRGEEAVDAEVIVPVDFQLN